MSFNNNLIRNQLVGQLEMLRAIPMAELSKPERILMASLPKQIAGIDAGMVAEKAAAAQKAHHEETVAKHKEAKAMKKAGKRTEQESFSLYADKTIQCGDCGEGFAFSGRQQEKFAEKQWTEPSRCDDCREYRKQFQHRTLQCVECTSEFDFSVGAQIHYVEQGFEDPVLCRTCRVAKRKVVPPELITCKECNKEFKFGYGEQMFFKEHGWQEPRRCIPCRKEHKAESAAKYAAKVAARAAAKAKPDLASTGPRQPDLGKFAEGADPTMKFGPLPPSPASGSSGTSEVGGINPADLIAAASAMVNGDGTFNTSAPAEEGWEVVGK